MLITFRNSYYNWYRPEADNEVYDARKHPFAIFYLQSLKNILIENFKSVQFSPEVPYDFNFKDKADEAYFLLWSKDGVEVNIIRD